MQNVVQNAISTLKKSKQRIFHDKDLKICNEYKPLIS